MDESSLTNIRKHGASLVELVLKLGLTELNCDAVEKPDYS